MSFARRYRADTAQIVTARDHDQISRVELDVVLDLVVLQVEAQSVVDLDVRVGVAESAATVRSGRRTGPLAGAGCRDRAILLKHRSPAGR